MSKVFFTKEILGSSLLKLYAALGVRLEGKVAVKLSSGEPGGKNFLSPDLIKPLVDLVSGTIVECNTAYEGGRNTTEKHIKTLKEHGFLDIASCDIMDSEGEIRLPVTNGFHLKENIVGSHVKDYQSLLVLSHFKGHIMGGFGGALKNMSIGIASSGGKLHIHNAGQSMSFEDIFKTDQDSFLRSMADACKSVIDFYKKENILYINVLNNLSIDCDCDSHPKAPEMSDIGILASLDPVALDKASVDMIYNSDDEGKASLIERIESRNAILTVTAAEELGLGSTVYELVSLD